MNADSHRLSFYLFTLPRQLVKFSPGLLLGGIHWRHLINIAAQTLKRGFDFVPAPWTSRFRPIHRIGNSFSCHIPGVSGIAKSNDCFVLFLQSTEKLSQPRCTANQGNQHAGGKRIQRSSVPHSAHVKYVPYTIHNIVRSQTRGLVDNQHSIHGGILGCWLRISDCGRAVPVVSCLLL